MSASEVVQEIVRRRYSEAGTRSAAGDSGWLARSKPPAAT